MSIVGSILLAATLTSAGSPGTAHTPVSSVSVPRTTLSDAVSAAARRESLALDQRQAPVASRPGPIAGRRPGRSSHMSRLTAIVAGALVGSLAGAAGGAVVDVATGNLECPVGTAVGLPIGAVLGAVLTAQFVR
jgi:hypothetical protein